MLNYTNARKVIDFVRKNDSTDDAHITSGGISIDISTKNYDLLVDYIESLNVRYEICDIPPYMINQQIIEDFRNT